MHKRREISGPNEYQVLKDFVPLSSARLILRHYGSIHLEGLTKITKTLTKHSKPERGTSRWRSKSVLHLRCCLHGVTVRWLRVEWALNGRDIQLAKKFPVATELKGSAPSPPPPPPKTPLYPILNQFNLVRLPQTSFQSNTLPPYS
jgi:hypothetical protein